MLTSSKSRPFSTRMSSVDPPPKSTTVPFSIVRSHEAPVKLRCASSRAESKFTGAPMAFSIALMASREFVQLRSTAVAKMSVRTQLK